MTEIGKFDTEVQMFVEPPHDARMNHLLFFRELMDRGKFGRKPLSTPRGEFVFRLSDQQIKKFAMSDANQSTDEKIRQHIAATGSY